jgi:hypothetical protein
MSLNDHRGSAYLFRKWMQAAQAEIDSGQKSGATVIYRSADAKKTTVRSRWRWPVIPFRKQA